MTRKQKNTAKTIIVIFIVLVLGCGVLMAITKGFTDWNPYGWFDKKTDQQEPAEDQKQAGFVYDGEGNIMTSNMSYAMPSAMVFSSTTAESRVASSGITINVTIYPVEASNKNLTWRLEWVNPSWFEETGETESDYIEVIGNTSKAIVKCIQPFSCQIKLYCRSVSNPEVEASCTLDYLEKVQDISWEFNTETNIRNTIEIIRLEERNLYFWAPQISTTEGTIVAQFKDLKFELKFTDEFLEFLRNRDEWKARCEELNADYRVLGQTGIPTCENEEYTWDFSSQAIARDIYNNDLGYKDVENFISTAITTLGRSNLIYAIATYKNNYGEEITYTEGISVSVNFATAVESISLDTTNGIL